MTRAAAIALVVAGAAAPARADDPVDNLVPESAPPEPVLPEPAALPEPATAPDPVAIHPAGLDPITLGRASASHVVMPACGSAAAASAPLQLAVALTGADFAYSGHPMRSSGGELSIRIELWNGRAWSTHADYTVDAIANRDGSTAYYDDLEFGGRIGLPSARAWIVGAAHQLSGAMAGNGSALYGALGARLGGLEVELGLGQMLLDGDRGTSVSLRATRATPWLDGWLALDGGDTDVEGRQLVHVGATIGVEVHRARWSLGVEALLGDRALTLTDGGETALALPDTFHTSGRALLGFLLASRVRIRVGVTARTATTPDQIDYSLVAGFAGLSLTL